ncbi:MAG: response regulator [Deltaproteobacteria bacterium]|nr:response regulator [Deltaproteobacteria bacterium]
MGIRSRSSGNMIAKRLFWQVLILASLLTIFFTVITGIVVYRNQISEIQRRFSQIQKSYSDVIQTNLWVGDKAQLELALIGICRLPGIAYAAIRSGDQLVCEAGKEIPEGGLACRYTLSQTYSGKRYDLGELYVQASQDYVYRHAVKHMLGIAATQAATIFLIGVLVLFLVYRTVGRRLQKVADYATSLSSVSLEIPLVMGKTRGRPDELDRLAENLNRMREDLKQAFMGQKAVEARLEQHSQNLEKMVERRTESLQATNRQLRMEMQERQRIEGVLREAKDDLDKAQEIARIGSWRWDPKTDRYEWSEEMYRIVGLTPGTPVQPTSNTLLTQVHPGDREHVARLLKEGMKGERSFEFEFRTIPIEGSVRVIRECGEIEFDDAGTPIGILGTVQDITEMRHLQTQVQEAQKVKAIATLAGGIAHRFNNALTPIIGNVDLLEMRYGEDEGTATCLKYMRDSGRHMAHLTSQLLAYARGGKYHPRTLSLTDFVQETLPILEPTLKPEVRIETDLPLRTRSVELDPAQMQMVLSAVVANSNDAMEESGRIRVSAQDVELDDTFVKAHPELSPGAYVCLTVADDGKGMDEETKNRMFEPFFTTHFIGRGLGMAAVYGIVTNHGGSITVDSEPGTGTTVRIYLPVAKEKRGAQGADTVAEPAAEPLSGEGTILVIEDEEMVVDLTRSVLERLGYHVLEARTGKAAVETAKAFDGPIDLALLDIKLPDMTGNQVYPLIKEARQDLKVVVCSGYAIDGPIQEILDAGADGFIQKPFSMSTMAEKVKEVLHGK